MSDFAGQSPLGSLKAALQRQLQQLQQGDIRAVADGMEGVRLAFKALPKKLSREDIPVAQEINRLYQQVTLALDSRMHELIGRMSRLRKGKGLIKAYGRDNI